MSHYDDETQLLSALVSNLHDDVADLALVSHARSATTVIHTTVDGDITYTIAPETSSSLQVQTGDMLTVLVREQEALLASGLYFIDCQAWESERKLLLMQGEYRMKLSQVEGVILPKKEIFDAIDALFYEEQPL